MELQTYRKTKILRSENEGEYKSDSFLQLCGDEGIEDTSQFKRLRNRMGSRKMQPYFAGEHTMLVVYQWAK